MQQAQEMHRELIAQSSSRYIPLAQLSISAAAASDREAAIGFAQQAWQDREPPLVMWARYYPGFDSIRDDPRFAAIIREMDEG